MYARASGLLALILALLVPAFAGAQTLGTSAPFTLSVAPNYPAPNSSIMVSPLSGSVDLTSASVAISANGTQIYAGNAQPVAITVGAAGAPVAITAVAKASGASYTESALVVPQDVSLVAEPVASVPPLYPGKPSVPVVGQVRVVAIARLANRAGVALNPAGLSYDWTVDGVEQGGGSGIGKTAIMAPSPLEYRASDVSVVVSSADGSLVGGADLSLSASEPTLRIYVDDPLLGLRYDHALSGTLAVGSTETTLYAAPFSFPVDEAAPLLSWFLGGSSVQQGSLITLRPTGSGAGNATLSVEASAGSVAAASASVGVSYGSSGGSSLFGL